MNTVQYRLVNKENGAVIGLLVGKSVGSDGSRYLHIQTDDSDRGLLVIRITPKNESVYRVDAVRSSK